MHGTTKLYFCNSFRVGSLQAELFMPLVEILEKVTIVRNDFIYFIYAILGFIIGRLALAIYFDRPNLAKVLQRTRWVVTECNLWFFGSKGHRICLL